MKALVKYVEHGGILETYDDVPNTIRDQLYAEERQRIEKMTKGSQSSSKWIDVARNQHKRRPNTVMSGFKQFL